MGIDQNIPEVAAFAQAVELEGGELGHYQPNVLASQAVFPDAEQVENMAPAVAAGSPDNFPPVGLADSNEEYFG